jgi:hypothetical protein
VLARAAHDELVLGHGLSVPDSWQIERVFVYRESAGRWSLRCYPRPMLQLVASLLLLILAAGLAVEACATAATTPAQPDAAQPSGQPTISLPVRPAKTPYKTFEIPPPID